MQPKIYNDPLYFDATHRFPSEEFYPIPDALPCYTISNYGRVKSEGAVSNNRNGVRKMPTKILTPGVNKHGYASVAIPKTYSLQTLMRKVFMPEMAHVREVDHKDGDKQHNALDNLECISSKQNKERAIKLGLINNVGEAHGMAKLTEARVWQVLEAYYLESLSRKKVGEKLGISEFTAKSIIIGENWKHVYAKFCQQHPAAIATNRAQTRLTADQAREIFQRGQTEKPKALAQEYGMSIDTVHKILNRKLWAAATT